MEGDMKPYRLALAVVVATILLLSTSCGKKIDEIRDGAIESFREEHGNN